MDGRPVLPTLRAAIFAAVCVALAESAHRLMSPGAIPLGASVGALAMVFALGRAAAGRERGLASITASMMAVQGALHIWFDAVQQTAGSAAVPSACAAMQPMPGMDAVSMCPSQGTMGLFAPYAGGMLAAHALAALAAAWWLRRDPRAHGRGVVTAEQFAADQGR